jgi:hypothetical protein
LYFQCVEILHCVQDDRKTGFEMAYSTGRTDAAISKGWGEGRVGKSAEKCGGGG